jgi:hypothetical protein
MLPTKDRTLADKQSRQRNHPPTSLPDPWCRRVTQNNNAMPLHRILSRWLGSTWIFQMDPQNGSFFVLKTIHFAGWLFWPPDFQGDIRPLPALWGACTRMGRTEPWKEGSWDKNLWELWECRESPTSCGLEQLFHFIYVHRFIVIFFAPARELGWTPLARTHVQITCTTVGSWRSPWALKGRWLWRGNEWWWGETGEACGCQIEQFQRP